MERMKKKTFLSVFGWMGPGCFLLEPTKKFSPQNGKKTEGRKWDCLMDKNAHVQFLSSSSFFFFWCWACCLFLFFFFFFFFSFLDVAFFCFFIFLFLGLWVGTLPLFFSILSSFFFYPFLDVASFSFSFLGGCGCDSCFFFVFFV